MKTPTPLELMSFYDGELDEARSREVRAWLANGANGGEGAVLVENFRTLGRHVRKAAPPPALPFDLSDRIMAALDAELAANADAELAPSQSRPSVKPNVPLADVPAPVLLPWRHSSATDALAPVLPLRPAASEVPPLAAQGPSPTSSVRPLAPQHPAAAPQQPMAASQRLVAPVVRRVFGWAPLSAAGMALAAAAAFLFWWSPMGLGNRTPGFNPPVAIKVNPSAAFGTDVDSVDFGVRMGSIFFVSNDAQATPVLWIDDDDDDDADDDPP
ncbi:MAG: hypothetical protein MUF34_17025 [Polyangiaceae bacterium]|jgi:hypothetical protein|nr:hypothetical protein [Polyangiaceae bacterium]